MPPQRYTAKKSPGIIGLPTFLDLEMQLSSKNCKLTKISTYSFWGQYRMKIQTTVPVSVVQLLYCGDLKTCTTFK